MTDHPHKTWNPPGTKGYDFTFGHDQINTNTCWNGLSPPNAGASCAVNPSEAVNCPIDHDFKVELFNRAEISLETNKPRSLGYQVVTREQIQCLGYDTIKIHFEYGKRQDLAGAETCFDHSAYIINTPDGDKEDQIPYTKLNICNKANTDRKRCFLYNYQVALHVGGPVVIQPKMFVKITFDSFENGVILPGDQTNIRFSSHYTNQDDVRIMPEIYSPNMPTPIKERYQVDGVTRLPCDDRKVADTIDCKNFYVFCTAPEQKINLAIQGAGEIYTIDETCDSFMRNLQINGNSFNWNTEENLLFNDFNQFQEKFADQDQRKDFTIE